MLAFLTEKHRNSEVNLAKAVDDQAALMLSIQVLSSAGFHFSTHLPLIHFLGRQGGS